MTWIVLASFIILLFVVAYVFLGPVISTLILLGSLISAAIWLFYQRATVHLDEMTVGVLFDRHGNFSRFLDSGHHVINPFSEYLKATLSKGNQSADDKTEKLRTKEGIPITLTWAVSAKINVFDIKPGLEHKMARVLPNYAPKVLAGKTIHALRHMVEQKNIYELHGEDALKQLEQELREQVYQRSKALGFQKPSPSNVKLGPIEVPLNVEKALEQAHARRLETEITVNALERLQAVIEQMDDTIMERLNELERLRIIDRVETQFYMMDTRSSRGGPGGPGGPPPGGRGAPPNSAGPQSPQPPAPGSRPTPGAN